MKIPYHAAVTVPRETTVAEAVEVMRREGVGSLLVTEHGRLVGIVTDRDIALRVIGHRIPFDGRIDSVMTCDVITVPPTAGRNEVIETFRKNAIRRLPVVDGGKLVGVITLDDLLAVGAARDLPALAEAVGEKIRHPRREPGAPAVG